VIIEAVYLVCRQVAVFYTSIVALSNQMESCFKNLWLWWHKGIDWLHLLNNDRLDLLLLLDRLDRHLQLQTGLLKTGSELLKQVGFNLLIVVYLLLHCNQLLVKRDNSRL
jgi:hypothetical protein